MISISPPTAKSFDAMHALNTQGMPIDLVTVDDELTRRGTLEGVGGTQLSHRIEPVHAVYGQRARLCADCG